MVQKSRAVGDTAVVWEVVVRKTLNEMMGKTHRCALCDAWYSDDEAYEHHHPEPQSGYYRDAWIKSLLPYEEWIEETEDGIMWKQLR